MSRGESSGLSNGRVVGKEEVTRDGLPHPFWKDADPDIPI
jgi:hypothetical protein